MKSEKYYDYQQGRPVDLDLDGCAFNDWAGAYGKKTFARHPKGFLVFLPPDELEASDEYKDADPYSVEENREGDFHKRRIECTLEMIKTAVQGLAGAPKILDLACGQGHITAEMLKMLPTAEVSGLDYAISAIAYAAEHYPGIDFIVGNAYACPYAENYFDVVVCNNLWEHVPDPLHLLRQVSRVLKPGGYIIISTPSRYRLKNLIKVIMGKPVGFLSKHHITEYSVGQVIEQLRYGGYQVTRVYSRSIPMPGMALNIVRAVLSAWISLVKSHHQLEATVFYLARKNSLGA